MRRSHPTARRWVEADWPIIADSFRSCPISRQIEATASASTCSCPFKTIPVPHIVTPATGIGGTLDSHKPLVRFFRLRPTTTSSLARCPCVCRPAPQTRPVRLILVLSFGLVSRRGGRCPDQNHHETRRRLLSLYRDETLLTESGLPRKRGTAMLGLA